MPEARVRRIAESCAVCTNLDEAAERWRSSAALTASTIFRKGLKRLSEPVEKGSSSCLKADPGLAH
jgi:hypothetical protein